MKITTWNKLWSRPASEANAILAASQSIHPRGRSERHREKERARRLARRGKAA